MLARLMRKPMVLASCLLMVACPWPITVCACSPSPTAAIVAGTVTRANAEPVAHAHVRATARRYGCADTNFVSFNAGEITQANEHGTYRLQLSATERSDSACVTIIAYATALFSSDSAVVADVIVRLRPSNQTQDSVRVDVQFP